MTEELLTVGESARALNVAPQTVRQWADDGILPHRRTPTGVRIFRRGDVERLRRQRERAGKTRKE